MSKRNRNRQVKKEVEDIEELEDEIEIYSTGKITDTDDVFSTELPTGNNGGSPVVVETENVLDRKVEMEKVQVGHHPITKEPVYAMRLKSNEIKKNRLWWMG